MILDSIKIKNFKGLKDCEFIPSQFGCLVGENNSGKSSVLQAIATGLNRSGQLAEALYYDPAIPVEFTLKFSGVNATHLNRLAPEHRNRISAILDDETLRLIIRFNCGQKCETTTLKLIPVNPSYRDDVINDVFAGLRPPAVSQTLTDRYPEFSEGCPPDLNITGAKAYLANKISELPRNDFELAETPLPTGIPTSIGQLIPEAIYIPAVKNFSDDLKTSQSTPFGRLLGLLLEGMQPAFEQIEQSLADLDGLLNRITTDEGVSDNRHERVQQLEASIQSYLRLNFPKISLELDVPKPELKTILNTAQIYIDDGSRDLIDNKGDGLKRSLTFALLQTYVEQRNQFEDAAVIESDDDNPTKRRPLIFLFEEPELYLHPSSQKVLFRTLAQISQNNQVIVTTHSPLFFSPGVTANFVRITKEASLPKPISRFHTVNFALDIDKAETFRLARFENADAAFFSRRVVLFEGESDDAFCKHVAGLLDPSWDFDAKSVSMVRVSGKGNFAKFRNFFQAFGLEVKVVADLDALFEGYEHLGAPPDLNELRAQAIAEVDTFIEENSIPAELNRRQIKDKVCQASWKQRYGRAKFILRKIQETGKISDEDVGTFDKLFTWEQDVARVRACRDHEACRAKITPILDALRQHGICILSKGAIEDYYPFEAEFGSKPQRALEAIRLLEGAEDLTVISEPLAEGRPPELHEIFSELFRDIP
ncbi:ATP-dependent nuclease [Croceicoccus sediminis]|uniref:ATP-dependent nuclease n=1 Tax=Croceicoccus sediminis TaxID=2571150 RepID=UPI001182D160|nr:AAA family ATPase [Croceicoccus sediminis]